MEAARDGIQPSRVISDRPKPALTSAARFAPTYDQFSSDGSHHHHDDDDELVVASA